MQEVTQKCSPLFLAPTCPSKNQGSVKEEGEMDVNGQ